LIVQRPLQSVDGVCFCVDWKELTLELLFKVGLGLNWENASIYLLAKEVLGPLRSTSILEEGEGPEDFFLVAGDFGLARCLDEAARAREGGLTGGEDISIGGGATVDTGAELVISWVICCN